MNLVRHDRPRAAGRPRAFARRPDAGSSPPPISYASFATVEPYPPAPAMPSGYPPSLDDTAPLDIPDPDATDRDPPAGGARRHRPSSCRRRAPAAPNQAKRVVIVGVAALVVAAIAAWTVSRPRELGAAGRPGRARWSRRPPFRSLRRSLRRRRRSSSRCRLSRRRQRAQPWSRARRSCLRLVPDTRSGHAADRCRIAGDGGERAGRRSRAAADAEAKRLAAEKARRDKAARDKADRDAKAKALADQREQAARRGARRAGGAGAQARRGSAARTGGRGARRHRRPASTAGARRARDLRRTWHHRRSRLPVASLQRRRARQRADLPADPRSRRAAPQCS